MSITTYLSTITLNVNGLNVLIKRHTVAKWITKQDPYIYTLSIRDSLQREKHTWTTSKGMEKDVS